MSIATEISRIQTAKADLKTAIEAKGVTVPSSATIDTYDDYVSQISGDDELIELIERTVTSIDIPDSVTTIGNYAFFNCYSLSSVTIPDSVTSIGDSAFFNCSGLTIIDIPDSVTSIDNSAFSNCSSLTSVTIPSNVTSIGIAAFSSCRGLASVTVNAITPPTIPSSYDYVFNDTNNCPIYVPSESVEAYKEAWNTYSDRIRAIPHDYSQDYFTMVALGDNFGLNWRGKVSGNCLSYSLDSGATWSEPSVYFEVTLANSGDTIMLKGSGMTTSLNRPIGTLRPTDFLVDYKVQGNIMSLLYGDNFVNQTDLSGYTFAFGSFFQGDSKTSPNTRLLSAENLVLPATTLAEGCYQSMFLNCTEITTAPILPATTLVTSCYKAMFKGCSSLNSITCLATDISASNCTSGWLPNAPASGTFTKAASMNDWTTGENGIPNGWTVVDYTE